MPGLRYLALGIELILLPGLRRYVIAPLVINILILCGLVGGGVVLFQDWMDWLLGALPAWLEFLYWVAWLLGLLAIVAVAFVCFTLLANLVAAPFNALLAVRVEDLRRGSTRWREREEPLPRVIVRALRRELAKLGYCLPRVLGLLLLSIIPGLNLLAPPLWLLFGAWMMAVEYTDYGADNNGVSFAELRAALAGQRITSLGFGILVYAMLLVPLLNLLVMPAAVAGGTAYWVDRLSLRRA